MTSTQQRLLLLATFMLNVTPLIAGQPTVQSHESIRAAIDTYLLKLTEKRGDNVQITVGRLDSRLRLNHCDDELSIFTPPGRKSTGRTTVGVRCEGSKPWTIYVPAQVGIIEQIVVANRNIPRGTLLTAEDLRLAEHDTTQLHRGYLTGTSQAIGKTTTRMVRRDTPLSPNKLDSPTAVKRGTSVTILSNTGAIEVRMKGTALGSGAIGDRIKVKNIRSNRQIDALIISPTLVRVDR